MDASPGSNVGNLDARSQNQQLRFGILAIASGLAGFVALQALGMPQIVRLALIPFFFVGTYGVEAALVGTCGFSALRGCRLTAFGSEPIADRGELAAVRRRGVAVVASSAVVAIAAAALLAFAG